jgi:hypothetical protein
MNKETETVNLTRDPPTAKTLLPIETVRKEVQEILSKHKNRRKNRKDVEAQ